MKQTKTRKGRIKHTTICWDCGRAKANSDCCWVNAFEPVPGWTAKYDEVLDSWAVQNCPNFTSKSEPLKADAVPDDCAQDMAHAIVSAEVDEYERILKRIMDLKQKRLVVETKGDASQYKRLSTKIKHLQIDLDSVRWWFFTDDARVLGVNNPNQILLMARERAVEHEAMKLIYKVRKKKVYKDTAFRTALRGRELDDDVLNMALQIDRNAEMPSELKVPLVTAIELMLKIQEKNRVGLIEEIEEQLHRREK